MGKSALEDLIQRSRVAQMQKLSHQILAFDTFALDLTRGCLLHEDEEIKLRPQTFATLKFLVENSGRLIGKDELIKAVWPDWNASDNQLARCLSEVRQALGDDEQRSLGVHDGLPLGGVEVGEVALGSLDGHPGRC